MGDDGLAVRQIHHVIGLLLGAEDDWPRAFEEMIAAIGPIIDRGRSHTLSTERLAIEPFTLDAPVGPELVVDRLAHWYYHPREWLKKAALLDGTYLLNCPFTFQSMEKHSSYCAMLRLGMKIPPTVLVPYKNPVPNERWESTASRYNEPFDLHRIADELGFPLYMKPFDGVGRRGVTRIENHGALQRCYDESGDTLMHLQAAVDYDRFARTLSIGPETMVMDFHPEDPPHSRYHVTHSFLTPSAGAEVTTISRVVNAFFAWEFNSAEMLICGDEVVPIDFANACPDVSLCSLHYYFPWAIKALVRWSAFCAVTGRRTRIDLNTHAYFAIADDPTNDYDDKLAGYLSLADEYFETDRYHDWCATALPHLDEQVYEWVAGPAFDMLLHDTVTTVYPADEYDRFYAHFRGLIDLWLADEGSGNRPERHPAGVRSS